ncbi:MAG: hypothetical protein HKN76_05825 [Saprospiraceae bacterium]|nr:hypothetical protein [Saprospiraceae bacterium]
MDLTNIQNKVNQYQKILENTEQYRQDWHTSLKQMIIDQLEHIIKETGLAAKVEVKSELQHMEAVALSLGHVESGISEKIGEANRVLIKSNGNLVYQQLFNGKVMITIMFPFIEGLGKPRPPKNVEILRPAELKPPFLLRHVEEFLKEIIGWEDFDDDVPQPIGFQMGGIPQDEVIQQP